MGKNPPGGFAYELFLDEKGEKISKSKGNGITIEEWLNYASLRVFHYICIKIQREQKSFTPDVVPKAVDEYLSLIEKFPEQKEKDKLSNPVWHIHNGNPQERI